MYKRATDGSCSHGHARHPAHHPPTLGLPLGCFGIVLLLLHFGAVPACLVCAMASKWLLHRRLVEGSGNALCRRVGADEAVAQGRASVLQVETSEDRALAAAHLFPVVLGVPC